MDRDREGTGAESMAGPGNYRRRMHAGTEVVRVFLSCEPLGREQGGLCRGSTWVQ